MKSLWVFVMGLMCFMGCSTDPASELQQSMKLYPDDPFSNAMVQSETFHLSGKESKVFESSKGVTVSVPEGAFLDENGEVFRGDINVEVASAYTADELISSHLMPEVNNGTLRNNHMVFVNATGEGRPLRVNPENPMYVEVPSDKDQQGEMTIFKGQRDRQGNMTWERRNPRTFLIPVDMEELDFYPDGFERTVIEGMPFRGHDMADRALIDSLYYALSGLVFEGMGDGISQHLKNGVRCGIDPASVQTIRGRKFQNTLISTHAFEQRMHDIHLTCNQKVLEVYANNLNKDLCQLDSMAAVVLKDHPLHHRFVEYAAQKLTNVKDAPVSARMLSDYYSRKLKQNREKLEAESAKYRKELEWKSKVAKKQREKFRALLDERQEYRTRKFGFEVTETGWYNAAVELSVDDLKKFRLHVHIENGEDFDRVHVYVLNSIIKSLFAMEGESKSDYRRGFGEDSQLLLWDMQWATVIAVGYKGDSIAFAADNFSEKEEIELSLTLGWTDNLRKDLRAYTWGLDRVNNIQLDLEYQARFAREQERQKRLADERLFKLALAEKALACCFDDEAYETGESLFSTHCTSCHSIGRGRVIGPDLKGIMDRAPSLNWLIKWNRNSQLLIASGDAYANKVFEENNKVIEPPRGLSEKQLKKIYTFIESFGPSTE
ncbi:MAG: cytochrome c [Flavobacteriales bacterium]|nr:cytochrome c [Flavobacteriales bacterium]